MKLNYVIIYSPSSCSKHTQISFFCKTQKIFWRIFSSQAVAGPYWLQYYFSFILWKSIETSNCSLQIYFVNNIKKKPVQLFIFGCTVPLSKIQLYSNFAEFWCMCTDSMWAWQRWWISNEMISSPIRRTFTVVLFYSSQNFIYNICCRCSLGKNSALLPGSVSAKLPLITWAGARTLSSP